MQRPLLGAVCVFLTIKIAHGQTLLSDSFEAEEQCAVEIKTPSRLETPLTMVNGPSACDYFIARPDSPPNSAVWQVAAKLTIEPGTVIKLDKSISVSVIDNGQIIAKGQSNQRILFAGKQPQNGYADGIYLANDTLTSEFDYVDFRYMGNKNSVSGEPDGALDGDNDAGVSLTNSTIAYSNNVGVDFQKLPVNAFANNRFFANASFPVMIGADQVAVLDTASDYAGGNQPNGLSSIDVRGVREPLTHQATWQVLNVPYYIDVALWVEDDGQLTLLPGTTFLMNEGASINIKDGGRLQAQGSSSQPIVFQSQDSSQMWEEIAFYKNANSLMDYVIVDGAGDNSDKSSIALSLNANLTLTNSTVKNGTDYAICTYRSVLNESNNQFIGLLPLTEC